MLSLVNGLRVTRCLWSGCYWTCEVVAPWRGPFFIKPNLWLLGSWLMTWSSALTICFILLYLSWWSWLITVLNSSCSRAKPWMRAIFPSIWVLIASISACSYSNRLSLLSSGLFFTKFPTRSVFNSSCPLDRFRNTFLNWASRVWRSWLSGWKAIAEINSGNMRDLYWMTCYAMICMIYVYNVFKDLGGTVRIWIW